MFTAETRSRSTVAIVEQARVAHLLHDLPGPELARIVQGVDSRWMALSCRLLTFLTQDVRTRLAYAVGEIANSFGIPDARGTLIPLRLSHEDFAELVGASRPTVSKQLKQMAQRGVFSKANGRYILARADMLAAMRSSGNSLSAAAQRLPRQPTSDQARGARHHRKSSLQHFVSIAAPRHVAIRLVGSEGVPENWGRIER